MLSKNTLIVSSLIGVVVTVAAVAILLRGMANPDMPPQRKVLYPVLDAPSIRTTFDVLGATYKPNDNSACQMFWQYSAPNATVSYTSSTLGIRSIQFPWNAAWGSPRYQLRPYDELDESPGTSYVLFGFLKLNSICNWGRQYAILPSHPLLHTNPLTGAPIKYKTISVGRHVVVDFSNISIGLCGYYISSTHPWALRTSCNQQSATLVQEDALTILRTLILTSD